MIIQTGWKVRKYPAAGDVFFLTFPFIELLRWDYRNVWSAAELQAKNNERQMVCANVFGLEWSQ